MIKILIDNAKEIDSLYSRLASNEWKFGVDSDNYKSVKKLLIKAIDKEDTIIRSLKEQGLFSKVMNEMKSIGRYYRDGDNIFDVIIDKYEYSIVRLQERLNLDDESFVEMKRNNLNHFNRQVDIFNHFLLIIDDTINDEFSESNTKKNLIEFKYKCMHMMSSEEKRFLEKDFSVDEVVVFGTDMLKNLDVKDRDNFKNPVSHILYSTVRSLMQVPKEEKDINDATKLNARIKLMVMRATLPFASEEDIEFLNEINTFNHLNAMMNRSVIDTIDVLLDGDNTHKNVQKVILSPFVKTKLNEKKDLNKDKE